VPSHLRRTMSIAETQHSLERTTRVSRHCRRSGTRERKERLDIALSSPAYSCYSVRAVRIGIKFPSVQELRGSTVWSTILRSTRDPSLEKGPRVIRQLIYQLPRDTAEWDFQPATPTCICLTCIGAGIDVDEPPSEWTLYKRTKKCGHGIVSSGLYSYGELEIQIYSLHTCGVRL
jgi:hypothetical protein